MRTLNRHLTATLVLLLAAGASFSKAQAAMFRPLELAAERTRIRFEKHVRSLYDGIGLIAKGLDFRVFRYALIGYYNLNEENRIKKHGIISVVDYRRVCNDKRLYIIDLEKRRLLFHTLVAHGKRTGRLYARHFSNTPGTQKSSLGFFVTGDTYCGKHGYSLYLEGMDAGFNDNAKRRAIVVHGAKYVSLAFAEIHGRIGRSWGCPAVPERLHRGIIDAIKGGTCLFHFYDELRYLGGGKYLDLRKAALQFERERMFANGLDQVPAPFRPNTSVLE